MALEKPSEFGDRSVGLRAAQYVRMSTDMQEYSIQNQFDAIAAFATKRGLIIVRTYADEGRSGLNIERREGLQHLIEDVKNGRTDFRFVLVYDVSRWGRFQDADESAYYEFLCKEAGIQVLYCAEMFENDGRPPPPIVTSADLALMERELKTAQKEFKAVEMNYGNDLVNLVVATRYVSILLSRPKIVGYLDANHPEILTEFRTILSAASTDSSGVDDIETDTQRGELSLDQPRANASRTSRILRRRQPKTLQPRETNDRKRPSAKTRTSTRQ